jgi:hypothetical protein
MANRAGKSEGTAYRAAGAVSLPSEASSDDVRAVALTDPERVSRRPVAGVSERRVGLFSERFFGKRIAGYAGNLIAGGGAASRFAKTGGRRPPDERTCRRKKLF